MDSTLGAFPSSSYHKQAFFGIACEKFSVSQSVHQSVKAFSAFPTNQLYANKPPRGIMISVHKFASESFRNVVGTLHPRYNLNSKQQTLLHNDILKATAVHTSLGPGRQNVILQVQESGRSLGKDVQQRKILQKCVLHNKTIRGLHILGTWTISEQVKQSHRNSFGIFRCCAATNDRV